MRQEGDGHLLLLLLLLLQGWVAFTLFHTPSGSSSAAMSNV